MGGHGSAPVERIRSLGERYRRVVCRNRPVSPWILLIRSCGERCGVFPAGMGIARRAQRRKLSLRSPGKCTSARGRSALGAGVHRWDVDRESVRAATSLQGRPRDAALTFDPTPRGRSTCVQFDSSTTTFRPTQTPTSSLTAWMRRRFSPRSDPFGTATFGCACRKARLASMAPLPRRSTTSPS